jgi:lysyl-tRNA synthetase class 2
MEIDVDVDGVFTADPHTVRPSRRPRRSGCPRVIDVQRHPQGPRVFLLSRRVHEYMLGGIVLAAVVAGWLSGLLHNSVVPLVAAALGVSLVASDWRDMFPSKRDSASWRLGVHRRVAPLREARQSEGIASLAALLALAVALVNLVSALTPSIPSRARLLLQVEPLSALPVFHALALPAAAALALVAFSLGRRRRRAVHVAMLLLVVLGVVNLLKGLDVEEAALSFGLAGLLWWGRGAFYVASEPLRLWTGRRRVPLVAIGVALLATAIVWAAVPGGTSALAIARETAALLTWGTGPVLLRGGFGWLPLGLGLMSLVGLLGGASVLFRRRSAMYGLAEQQTRGAALELVRAHGRDTLAFFKLRGDAHHFFSTDRKAFLAYRVENGVLLVSGDPVGPPEALAGLLRDVCSFAEKSGLKLGAIGVGRELLPLYRRAGLQSLYLGDEAVVDTRAFSLEGRAVRKVRQSLHRLEHAGFTATIHDVGALDPATLTELESASALWRGGEPDRGFAMAMDSLVGEHLAETVVILARDAEGAIRGYIHFVPTYDRAAMSLSQMRRDRSTPNGLTEFLVVRSIELLRRRGVEELSLNFAAFARLLTSPAGRLERLLARLIRLGNPFFQIESLYRFNAKFQPRWEPRYLLYERSLGLPRVGLAALRAEGFLPRFRALPVVSAFWHGESAPTLS